jgi:Flp pilus assembly protein TadB
MNQQAPQKENHVWYYYRDGMLQEVEEGPFDEKQLAELAKLGKLKLNTKLRSPTRTKNQLVFAETITKLATLINQSKLDAETQKRAAAEQKAVAKQALSEQRAAEKHQLELERQALRNEQLARKNFEAQQQAVPVQPQFAVQHHGQPQVVVINNQSSSSNTMAAILNVFLPPWGQLVQGRIAAFFIWYAIIFAAAVFIILVGIATFGFGLILGFIIGPIIYILCIVDAARYRR